MPDETHKPQPSRPLTERLKERLTGLAEELLDAVAEAFSPPMRPIPVRVRKRPYRY